MLLSWGATGNATKARADIDEAASIQPYYLDLEQNDSNISSSSIARDDSDTDRAYSGPSVPGKECNSIPG